MKSYMEDCLDMPLREVLEIMQRRIMQETTYFGVRALKCPMDMWVYQEMIYENKPDVIVEIGNKEGGSTLAFAHYLDMLDHGKVVAVDIDHSRISDDVRRHPRVSLIESPGVEAYEQVSGMITSDARVMVIEDSSHTYDNTLEILNKYTQLLKPGDYFIVEDSICHHGLELGPAPGPYEAIEQFVTCNQDFEIDRSREGFLITWNPKGYLKRVN